MLPKNPIIVALDVESPEEARGVVAALGPSVDFYKVGLELYAAAGMQIVDELAGAGKRVFLDLKLYDIGETVRRAAVQVSRHDVAFLTVHAMNQVVRAAVEGKGSSALQVLAVTVLTSFDRNDLQGDGHHLCVNELVDLRVRNAVANGTDGIVCSPAEVGKVRSLVGPNIVLVTPGVRSQGVGSHDQKRVATPKDAVRDGADYLVIGRQITRAADPRREAEKILEEIAI